MPHFVDSSADWFAVCNSEVQQIVPVNLCPSEALLTFGDPVYLKTSYFRNHTFIFGRINFQCKDVKEKFTKIYHGDENRIK